MAISYYLLKDDNGDAIGVLVRKRPTTFPVKEQFVIQETTKVQYSKTLKALTK